MIKSLFKSFVSAIGAPFTTVAPCTTVAAAAAASFECGVLHGDAALSPPGAEMSHSLVPASAPDDAATADTVGMPAATAPVRGKRGLGLSKPAIKFRVPRLRARRSKKAASPAHAPAPVSAATADVSVPAPAAAPVRGKRWQRISTAAAAAVKTVKTGAAHLLQRRWQKAAPYATGLSAKILAMAAFIEGSNAVITSGVYRISTSTAKRQTFVADLLSGKDPLAAMDPTNASDVHLVAGALKQMLRVELPPLLTATTVEGFVAAGGNVDNMFDALLTIDAGERLALLQLTSHLFKVAKHADANLMGAYNLAIIFAPTLGFPVGEAGGHALEALIMASPHLVALICDRRAFL